MRKPKVIFIVIGLFLFLLAISLYFLISPNTKSTTQDNWKLKLSILSGSGDLVKTELILTNLSREKRQAVFENPCVDGPNIYLDSIPDSHDCPFNSESVWLEPNEELKVTREFDDLTFRNSKTLIGKYKEIIIELDT